MFCLVSVPPVEYMNSPKIYVFLKEKKKSPCPCRVMKTSLGVGEEGPLAASGRAGAGARPAWRWEVAQSRRADAESGVRGGGTVRAAPSPGWVSVCVFTHRRVWRSSHCFLVDVPLFLLR